MTRSTNWDEMRLGTLHSAADAMEIEIPASLSFWGRMEKWRWRIRSEGAYGRMQRRAFRKEKSIVDLHLTCTLDVVIDGGEKVFWGDR
ncbi:uncharacterized protein TrAFT101_005631 [Trichoderma asperellum]|uniref:uncharacterized protein n=1 Tax=Trichoderma asperellum TaxID=101201 RepID=UPI00331D293B|nr:hypothetical protein TrAFT101_005631 [Trichoderma asperellum]